MFQRSAPQGITGKHGAVGKELSLIELETLLAGPIVRRAEPGRVLVWVATSTQVEPRVRIHRLRSGEPGDEIGAGGATTVRLGLNLWVHLLAATPHDGTFPAGEILGYDLEFAGAGYSVRLADLAPLSGPEAISYQGLVHPTFFLSGDGDDLNLIHGSCRMLHGGGEDALLAADEAIRAAALEPRRRPAALFFTGDQIYGDEVAGPLIGHIDRLAQQIAGPGDPDSIPDIPSLDRLPLYGRADLIKEKLRFTSDHGHNHLMSFGEFAGMYLLAWNVRNWPQQFPSFAEARLRRTHQKGISSRRHRLKYALETRRLERARAALGSTRRVLANTATYMIFDDHDVTDDWNLSMAWRDTVRASAAGRRVVANALAAFWAFQGWGNSPDDQDDELPAIVSGFLGNGTVSSSEYEDAMWDLARWSFVAPTQPRSVFLDTRTQRSYDTPHGPARLIGPEGSKRVVDLVRRAQEESRGPLIVVSAVPIVGLEVQERRQKFLVKQLGPYAIDFEAWNSNLQGFIDFMHLWIDDLGIHSCIFLSGDVHYGMNLRFEFDCDRGTLSIVQLVSSGAKHCDRLSRAGLDLIGHVLHKKHERIGWESPPDMNRGSLARKIATRVMMRRPNTDSWTDESPVLLTPTRARQIKITDPPHFREIRSYIRPDGPAHSFLVGENNVGLVRVAAGGEVTHQLLSRGRNRTSSHTASMRVTEG